MIESISSNQMQMMHQIRQQMQQRFQVADTDGTRGLSKDELSSLSENLKAEGKDETSFIDKLQEGFDRLDSDGNGQLTRNEVHAGGKKAGLRPPPGSPPPGMLKDDVMSQETVAEESYIDKLLKKLYSPDYLEDKRETVSYAV